MKTNIRRGEKNTQRKILISKQAEPSSQSMAFTLAELLVVIVIVAVLAMVVLPAVAGIQNKGGRADCANNLRQIDQDSMIFASENNGWLPVCTLGAFNGEGTKSNYLGGEYYTRYVYIGGSPNTFVTTNEPPLGFGNGYQNLGYLYQDGLAGNGSIFFCPDETDPVMMKQYYSPLLTADSSGTVLSSYMYNPRLTSSGLPGEGPQNLARKYQKTSDLEPHKLFAMDSIDAATGGSGPDGGTAAGVNPVITQHSRDHGWNVLFTDGSVQFARLSENNNYFYNLIITRLTDSESTESYEEFDQTFTFLEQDH